MRRLALVLALLTALLAPAVLQARPADVIVTVAGGGTSDADGIHGTEAAVRAARGIAFLPDGALVFADGDHHRVRRIAQDGTITTIAGTGVAGSAGDGGPATAAQLDDPSDVAPLPDGGFLITESGSRSVRRVAPDGTISTVMGGAAATPGGSYPKPATSAFLVGPASVSVLPNGDWVVVDFNNGIFRVSGGTAYGLSSFRYGQGSAPLPNGDVLVTSINPSQLLRIAPDGTTTVVAGTGADTSTGDGGPATAATVQLPGDVAVAEDGSWLLAEANRVRRIAPDGTISTVAGGGIGGDGTEAVGADVNPAGVVAMTGRAFAITEFTRVRRVTLGEVPDAPVAGTTPPGPAPPPVTPQPPSGGTLPPPVLGRNVNLEPAAGRVTVRAPGAKRFRTLSSPEQLGVGAEVDATKGDVVVVSAVKGGKAQRATFSKGRFKIRQQAATGGLTRLQLTGGSLAACPPRRPAKASAAAKRRKPAAKKRGRAKPRRLWGDGKGRFQTDGRHAAATVQGTRWLTEDRCEGTFVRVVRGRVEVRDLARKRTVTVKAGRSVLIRAPRG